MAVTGCIYLLLSRYSRARTSLIILFAPTERVRSAADAERTTPSSSGPFIVGIMHEGSARAGIMVMCLVGSFADHVRTGISWLWGQTAYR